MTAGLLALLGISAGVPTAALADEARAVWFHRWEWNNRQDIEDEIANIDDCNMNAVLFQIRGQGDAFYISEHEPWSHLVGDEYPGYDPLAVAIYEAHKKGLELHAYVNAMPAWSDSTPPVSPYHIYNAHPEWIMVDSLGVPMDPAAGYANISPGIPQAAQHVNNVIMDIATNYDVDGIHLDYIRYPGWDIPDKDYSYDDSSLARFARDYPGCTPNTCLGEWKAFRRTLVTEVVETCYDSVTALKPWVKISAATWGIFSYGYNYYYQDSHGWMEAGILDFSAPRIYTHNTSTFQSRLHDHAVNAYGRHVYGGIGLYLGLGIDTLLTEIDICRSEGVEGQALFAASDLYGSHKTALIGSGGPYEYPDSVPAMAWKGSQPFIASVALPINTTQVDVLFSSDVDPVTGQDPDNYVFDSGLTTLSATRDLSDHRLVHLTTNTHYDDFLYTLMVTDVQEEGSKAVVAWPNNQRQFYGKSTYPPGIIVDNEDVDTLFTFVGNWKQSVTGECFNHNKHYHTGPGGGDSTATWTTAIDSAGNYAVFFWVNYSNYTADAHYIIHTATGPDSTIGDQNYEQQWNYLGTYPFSDTARVTVTNYFTTGSAVIADAIHWVYLSPLESDAPPAAITDLASHKSAEDIVLNWSAVTSDTLGNPETISEYVVYRDTLSYSPPGDSVGSTTDTTFTDPGAAGSTGTNYYYVVRAVDDGQAKSTDSNQVGEFNRELGTSVKTDLTKKIKSLR
jgi:uncharacterized lipoprotein YddW (UPF0748 family)